jgi:hypothetical protein
MRSAALIASFLIATATTALAASPRPHEKAKPAAVVAPMPSKMQAVCKHRSVRKQMSGWIELHRRTRCWN